MGSDLDNDDTPPTLGALTWTEITDADPPVVIVPVGSCEQHGPHLPLSTDTIIAEALAERLAVHLRRSGRRSHVAPALGITASGEHQGFAGTLSIGTDVVRHVIVELVRSADWSAGVVLVNGHGGNHPAVTAAVDVLVAERRRVLAWWPARRDVSGRPDDLHAGHIETSLMLALRPDLVRTGIATAGPAVAIDALREHGVRALSGTGVLGDPTTASADAGAEILSRFVGSLTRSVDTWIEPAAP